MEILNFQIFFKKSLGDIKNVFLTELQSHILFCSTWFTKKDLIHFGFIFSSREAW